MLNKFASLASLLIVSFFFSGCALQSSLVSIEEDMQQEREWGQKLQDNVDTLRVQVEKQAKEIQIQAKKPQTTTTQPGISEMLGEVNQMKEDMRRLEGRIEETGRKASEAMRATDDQSHQVETLSNRLSNIEKVPLPEKIGTSPVVGMEEMPLLSPTEAYTLAYNDYLRGNYDLAILGLQNFLSQYPNSTQVPQALYWIGQSHYSKSAYAEAIPFFEQVETRFPQHDTTPNAILKIGISYVELSKIDLAKTALQKVVDKFPQSNEASLAKDKLENLK